MATTKKAVKKATSKAVKKSSPAAKVKAGVFWPMKAEEFAVFKLFYPKGPTQDLYRTLFEDLFIRARNRLNDLKLELDKLENNLGVGKEQKRLAEIQARKKALEMKLELMTAEVELLKAEGEAKKQAALAIKQKRSELAKLKGKHKVIHTSKTAHAKLLNDVELLSVFLHGRK